MNFLDGYYSTAGKIKNKNARAEFITAVVDYFYSECEPSFKYEVSEVAFSAVKYSLDKAITGKKGGNATQAKLKKLNSARVAKTEKNELCQPTKEDISLDISKDILEKEEEREKQPSTFDNSGGSVQQSPKIAFAKNAIEIFNEVTGQGFLLLSSDLVFALGKIYDSQRTLEDVRIVVKTKFREWGDDSKMAKFVRPSTLFGQKFEEYLTQSKLAKPKSNPKLVQYGKASSASEYMEA